MFKMREAFKKEFRGIIIRFESPSRIAVTTQTLHDETCRLFHQLYEEAQTPAATPYEEGRVYAIRVKGYSLRARFLRAESRDKLKFYAIDTSVVIQAKPELVYELPDHQRDEDRAFFIQLGGIKPVDETWDPALREKLHGILYRHITTITPFEGHSYGQGWPARLTLRMKDEQSGDVAEWLCRTGHAERYEVNNNALQPLKDTTASLSIGKGENEEEKGSQSEDGEEREEIGEKRKAYIKGETKDRKKKGKSRKTRKHAQGKKNKKKNERE